MRAPLLVSEPAILTTGNGVMNATDAAAGGEPADAKLPSTTAGGIGAPAAGAGEAAAGGGAFACDLALAFGGRRGGGLRTVVRATVVVGGRVVVGRVVVDGDVVVLGTVVLGGVVLVDPPVVVSPVDEDPVLPSPPVSWARLATGPIASSAPMAAAATKANGERTRPRTLRPRRGSREPMPERTVGAGTDGTAPPAPRGQAQPEWRGAIRPAGSSRARAGQEARSAQRW